MSTMLLSFYRYISILPVIPITVHLTPQEAIDARHPQDTRHPQPPIPKISADLQTDLTLYKVAALGLAAGVLLVLLLFCLYRVLCPRNYGQNGVPHGRRRRGDLPCDDYGYSPPVSEISPLLLRGHSMVRLRWTHCSLCLSIKQTHWSNLFAHSLFPLSFFFFLNNVS